MSEAKALFELGLLLAGLVASLVAMASAIWLVVIAFQTHIGWGIGVWFCYPFGAMAFAVQNWRKARWAALVHFVSFALALAMLGAVEVLDQTLPEEEPGAVGASPSPGP